MGIQSTTLSWALTVVVEETNSGVPLTAVLPVIRNLWPNLAWRGRTKGIRQQIASGAKQKPPLLMRQKACRSPANPQELPDATQTKPEIKRSQRQAHFYSKAKVFRFHGLGGFPVEDGNGAEKWNDALPFSVTDFEKAGFSSCFFLSSFPALSTFTPPTTLSGLILKVLKFPLVAFRGCQMMFNSFVFCILTFRICRIKHIHLCFLAAKPERTEWRQALVWVWEVIRWRDFIPYSQTPLGNYSFFL